MKIRELCRPYLTFYPLDIYSNNIVTISLIHSHFPLSFWKMITSVSMSLNEERKACLLGTDSFVLYQYKPGLICT